MRLPILLVLVLAFLGSAAAADTLTVLCYHEVRDDVREYPDPYAVDSESLVRQFEWLRGNGHAVVSLAEVVAARQGGKALPPKAVLLTFDDGYLSFYTRVYPLLREFGFPAVLGVVGKWIESPSGAEFPNWGQMREMAASGLVEIASHSYDLHHGIPGNPQGNLQSAATTRIYDPVTGSYEDDASWRSRVRADLARNSSLIERETGRRPRAIVWPYGAYNGELVRIAGELGMTVGMTLDDGANTPAVPLAEMRRILMEHNPSLGEFIAALRGPVNPEPVRVVQVNLDDVYSADALQQERNLSLLLARMKELKPTQVHLRATAGDNAAAYFPNRHLPLRADLFNRAAWQLVSRAGVRVHAVMPVAGLRLPPAAIAEVYEDLARHASFHGLVFEDGTAGLTQQLAARTRAFRAPLKTEGDAIVLRNTETLPAQMRALQLGGRIHFGYATDGFLRDDPPLARIAPAMSLRAFPLAPAAGER